MLTVYSAPLLCVTYAETLSEEGGDLLLLHVLYDDQTGAERLRREATAGRAAASAAVMPAACALAKAVNMQTAYPVLQMSGCGLHASRCLAARSTR